MNVQALSRLCFSIASGPLSLALTSLEVRIVWNLLATSVPLTVFRGHADAATAPAHDEPGPQYGLVCSNRLGARTPETFGSRRPFPLWGRGR